MRQKHHIDCFYTFSVDDCEFKHGFGCVFRLRSERQIQRNALAGCEGELGTREAAGKRGSGS